MDALDELMFSTGGGPKEASFSPEFASASARPREDHRCAAPYGETGRTLAQGRQPAAVVRRAPADDAATSAREQRPSAEARVGIQPAAAPGRDEVRCDLTATLMSVCRPGTPRRPASPSIERIEEPHVGQRGGRRHTVKAVRFECPVAGGDAEPPQPEPQAAEGEVTRGEAQPPEPLGDRPASRGLRRPRPRGSLGGA